MSAFIESKVLPILSTIQDPVTQLSLLDLQAVDNTKFTGGKLSLSLTLPYPDAQIRETLVKQLAEQLLAIDEVDGIDIDAGWQAPSPNPLEGKKPINNVKNVIAVASGKGGVGKSTTTVVAYGVESMSMGYLLSEKTPAVWRGPMATGALNQLIFQTDWGDLDYLFVDMPPGTGDIQLTLSQQVPVTGAVVVTTPQDIALLDAKKAIEMFRKVNVPILGVVENMAVHHCSQCGFEEHIFGAGGGERIARDYGTQLFR